MPTPDAPLTPTTPDEAPTPATPDEASTLAEPDEARPVDETPLTGGNMGPVSRIGDEVRRTAGPWSTNVHRLLACYAEAGIDEAPRPLGFTADGRERLSYLPGDVPHDLPDWLWSQTLLTDTARLLRRLHDASVPLAGERDGWRSPVHEPAEVVCHNDVAPYNLVFQGGRPTGIIDFDYASPGPRLWDLAYLAYRLVPLTRPEAGARADPSGREARIRLLVTSYGLDATPVEVVATAVAKLHELAVFSDAQATALRLPELAVHAAGYRADAEALLTDGLDG